MCSAILITVLPSDLHAEELQLLSSIEPVNKLVAEIVGNRHDRRVLWRKNQSVHNVSFKPSQINAVTDADLIFWVGPMLESPLDTLLSSVDIAEKSIRLANADVYYLKDGEGVHENACVADWHECDPHIWLSTSNAEVMATAIARALEAYDPDNAWFYNRNLDAYKEKTRQHLLRKALAGPPSEANILVLHNGWQYLGILGYEVLGEHGLEYVGAKTALELQRKVRHQNIDCILAGPMTKLALAENVLAEVEQSPGLLTLDPMGADFPDETSFLDYLELSRKSITHCSVAISD